MTREEYQAYLRGAWWQAVRRAALALWNYTCADCGYRRMPYRTSGKRLEVHHLNYACLYHEEPTDVRVLCEDCHAARHGIEPDGPIAGSWYPVRVVLNGVIARLLERIEYQQRYHPETLL